MNTAWNRWLRNLSSGTALSLYDNRITPIIITDRFLLGTGRMPHPVGGAMGVTLCLP